MDRPCVPAVLFRGLARGEEVHHALLEAWHVRERDGGNVGSQDRSRTRKKASDSGAGGHPAHTALAITAADGVVAAALHRGSEAAPHSAEHEHTLNPRLIG